MQIPEAIRKCVVFLCGNMEGKGITALGTAFSVVEPVLNGTGWVRYLVTAGHVITYIEKSSFDQVVYVRINCLGGGTKNVPTKASEWIHHQDDAVDLAAIPMAADFAEADHPGIPISMFLDEATATKQLVGPGDELFFPGLFTGHSKTSRNIPIIRTGAIAAMPEESVATSRGYKLRAYLAEARSIGGLSGSPVFLYLNPHRVQAGGKVVLTTSGPEFHLLGVVHGHYDSNALDFDIATDAIGEDADSIGRRERFLNMGIAIVTPVSEIVTLLQHERLAAFRERIISANQVHVESTWQEAS